MYFLKTLMYNEHILNASKTGSIFENLTFYDHNSHKISDFQMGIVGVDERSLTAFRNSFYLYGDHFQLPVLDFGLINVTDNLTQNLEQLSSQIPLIVIGGSPLTFSQSTAVVSKLLDAGHRNEMKKFIGYQRHLAKLDDYNQIDEYQNISLGELRKNSMMVEPLMRTCTNISFDLSAIKQADLGIDANNIVGLTLEEASQISRYAGISPDMRIAHFPNLQPQFAFGNVSKEYGACVSTMVWYYLEGLLNLNYESPSEDEHISYVINSEYFEEPLTFLKGQKSGRWWMKYGENADYFPCLHEDFIQSKEGNIPDRLYKYCLS